MILTYVKQAWDCNTGSGVVKLHMPWPSHNLTILLLLLSLRPAAQEANDILHKTSAALLAPSAIQYDHERLVISDGQSGTIRSVNYLEPYPGDSLIGSRYQLKTDDGSLVYNGSEFFELNHGQKTIRVNQKPRLSSLENYYLYNSILTLQKNLPLIMADKTIRTLVKDTSIQGQTYYMVTIPLYKKTFEALGGFFPVSEDRWFIYSLVIHKNTFLPELLIQKNHNPSGQVEQEIRVSYRNYRINAKPPEETFFYSSYLRDHQRITAQKNEASLVKAGTLQVNFTLPRFPDGTPVSIQPRPGIQVIQFWISNCGYCIESVGKFNRLQEKFAGGDIRFLGVNAHDNKPTIERFAGKHGPRYPLLMDGAEVARKYGIDGFPTVLILQDGVVRYAGATDEQALEAAIRQLLRN